MKIAIALFTVFIAIAVGAEPPSQSQPAGTPGVYRHATGLEFTYPAGWSTNSVPYAEVQLVPADQQTNERGVTEGFFVFGLGGTYKGPAYGALKEYVDMLVQQIAPFLKQAGEGVPISHPAGPAFKMDWAGISSDGMAVSARAFILVRERSVFVLLMLGNQDRMKARESAIAQIFSTFRVVERPRDPALQAAWKTPAAAQSSPQTQPQSQPAGLAIEIRKDGTFSFKDPSGADPEAGKEGEWYSLDGQLCFVFSDSFFLEFTYELEGDPGSRKLILHHASGGFQELLETPSEPK